MRSRRARRARQILSTRLYPHRGFGLKWFRLSEIMNDHFLQPIENRRVILQIRQEPGVTGGFSRFCTVFVASVFQNVVHVPKMRGGPTLCMPGPPDVPLTFFPTETSVAIWDKQPELFEKNLFAAE